MFCSIFSGAGKFCLAHGLRQLTRDTKSDVICLQTTLTRRNEKLRITFAVARQTAQIVKKSRKQTILFNNQSSVFDADREVQPSGQRIMPRTRLISFPALSVYPRVGISLSASTTDDRFHLSVAYICIYMRYSARG